MPRIIDLFAGLGGIRLGFQQAMDELGLETECVFSSEIKPYAIKAYNGFYGDEEIYGDITLANTNQDIPDFDYLLAGFPCQPFSSAGNKILHLSSRRRTPGVRPEKEERCFLKLNEYFEIK